MGARRARYGACAEHHALADRSRTHPESTGFYFFGASEERDADPLAVRAASTVLEEMEPGWFAPWRKPRRADCPEVIAAWSELPIEAVLAATGN